MPSSICHKLWLLQTFVLLLAAPAYKTVVEGSRPTRSLLQASNSNASNSAAPRNTNANGCNQSIADVVIALSTGFGFSWLPLLMSQGVFEPFKDPNYSLTVFLTLEGNSNTTCLAPSGATVRMADLYPNSGFDTVKGNTAVAQYLNRGVVGYHCVDDLIEMGTINTVLGDVMGVQLPLNFSLSPKGKAIVSFGSYQTEIIGSRDVCGKSMLHVINSVIWPWTEYWGVPGTGLPPFPSDLDIRSDFAAIGAVLPPAGVAPPPGICAIPSKGCPGVEPRTCSSAANAQLLTDFGKVTLAPVKQDCTPLLKSNTTALSQSEVAALLAVPRPTQDPPPPPTPTPPAPAEGSSSKSQTIGLAVGIPLAVLSAAVMVLVGYVFVVRARRPPAREKDQEVKDFWEAIAKAADTQSDAKDDSTTTSRPNALWRVRRDTLPKATMREVSGPQGLKTVATVPLNAMLRNYGYFPEDSKVAGEGQELDALPEDQEADHTAKFSVNTRNADVKINSSLAISHDSLPVAADDVNEPDIIVDNLLASSNSSSAPWRSASAPSNQKRTMQTDAVLPPATTPAAAAEPALTPTSAAPLQVATAEQTVPPSDNASETPDEKHPAAASVTQQHKPAGGLNRLRQWKSQILFPLPMWSSRTAPSSAMPQSGTDALADSASKPAGSTSQDTVVVGTGGRAWGTTDNATADVDSAHVPLFPVPDASDSEIGASSRRVISQLFVNHSNTSHTTAHSIPTTPYARPDTLPQALQEIFIPSEALSVVLDEDGDPHCEGQGGFGTVFRGLWGNVQVAIKLPGGASMMVKGTKGDRREQHQLLREVAHMRDCDHPHLLRLLGLSFLGSNLVLITPYMEGGDLFKALDGPNKHMFMWDNNGKYIALQLLHALQYLHARHIVHLDVKPQNVLLDAAGTTAYIADLGMSAVITQGYLTAVSSVGTFAWAAPEMLLGSRITTAADMYSYGVILWQLLTGRTPRRGALSIAGLDQKYPQELVNLLQATLHTFPDMRPTAADAAQILLRVITGDEHTEHAQG